MVEAKMNFVKAWQSLPDYGVSLFVVRFHGEKKDELLGVAANKIMRMTLNAGDHIKTWRFSTMKVTQTVPSTPWGSTYHPDASGVLPLKAHIIIR